MITEDKLNEIERKLENQDEYDMLAWGSKHDIKILLEEVRRLKEKCQVEDGKVTE